MTITRDLIRAVVNKIVERCDPVKMILFGSCSRGKLDADSDIDLFVIMDSNLRRDKRALDISRLFSDRLFAMDIIVYTPDEVELSLRRGSPFTKEILSEGEVLYERKLEESC